MPIAHDFDDSDLYEKTQKPSLFYVSLGSFVTLLSYYLLVGICLDKNKQFAIVFALVMYPGRCHRCMKHRTFLIRREPNSVHSPCNLNGKYKVCPTLTRAFETFDVSSIRLLQSMNIVHRWNMFCEFDCVSSCRCHYTNTKIMCFYRKNLFDQIFIVHISCLCQPPRIISTKSFMKSVNFLRHNFRFHPVCIDHLPYSLSISSNAVSIPAALCAISYIIFGFCSN